MLLLLASRASRWSGLGRYECPPTFPLYLTNVKNKKRAPNAILSIMSKLIYSWESSLWLRSAGARSGGVIRSSTGVVTVVPRNSAEFYCSSGASWLISETVAACWTPSCSIVVGEGG